MSSPEDKKPSQLPSSPIAKNILTQMTLPRHCVHQNMPELIMMIPSLMTENQILPLNLTGGKTIFMDYMTQHTKGTFLMRETIHSPFPPAHRQRVYG
jgi:hypothetical protein